MLIKKVSYLSLREAKSVRLGVALHESHEPVPFALRGVAKTTGCGSSSLCRSANDLARASSQCGCLARETLANRMSVVRSNREGQITSLKRLVTGPRITTTPFTMRGLPLTNVAVTCEAPWGRIGNGLAKHADIPHVEQEPS
eukprot:6179146-Pleurochrysis_carterae.AAC.1